MSKEYKPVKESLETMISKIDALMAEAVRLEKLEAESVDYHEADCCATCAHCDVSIDDCTDTYTCLIREYIDGDVVQNIVVIPYGICNLFDRDECYDRCGKQRG